MSKLSFIDPVAARQPKTDRLILARNLKQAANDLRLAEEELKAAHAILVKWADLETSGRLETLNETQMQGEFLAEVFGAALGYAGPMDGVETWHREQHPTFNDQTPDGALGLFRQGEAKKPLAVVELKGPTVNLDRDRSNGRTAVDQCWDYLVNLPPACRWGVVSNFVSFRLYERDSTKRAYEHFTLQSLRDFNEFKQFYVLFQRQGLVENSPYHDAPRAVFLLKQTAERQREVGDQLYDTYSRNRTDLIAHLAIEKKIDLDLAIEMVQRLLDRIIFVAFCEDRHLLTKGTIHEAYKVAGFHAVTNPRWQNFKNLFRFIDQGSPPHKIPKFNGGLFAKHPVDDLDLPDDPWTTFFNTIGGYDFADEVNLDVLGHLFERSITEIEKLKTTGIFTDGEKAEQYAKMPQSAKRKQLGIYYTPVELTSRIVQYAVEELIAERFAAAAVEFGVSAKEAARGAAPDDAEYWKRCLAVLRNLKIVDPACGSGAFLFQAYNALELRYLEVLGQLERAGDPSARDQVELVPRYILEDNLYGVDLSPEAVEITQLALWIRSASPEQTLAKLSDNIVHGNSLVHDAAAHPHGFDWRKQFPQVFEREEAGFDCVIGNPPWERIKLQEREFFSLPAPEIATATNAAKRRQLVAKLEKENPALFARYNEALAASDSLLSYCRKSGHYPLTGKGDINTYAVFSELAYNLVAPHGRVGFLVPSGIASDNTTKDFFAEVAESNRLIRLFDFENRLKKFFPEVDGRFKFCILNFGGAKVAAKKADFVFFAHRVEELENKSRHVVLSGDDIRLLNPNTRTCPIFRSRRDGEITKAIYRRVPILIDRQRKGPTGNPWGIDFKTMFHQTNDAELFREAEKLKSEGYIRDGNRWRKDESVCLPLYEAKMVQAYNHRAADVVTESGNWVRQGQTEKTSLVQYQNPEHVATPRFWIDATEVQMPEWGCIGFKDITSPTNQRTMIASCAPHAGFTNHFIVTQSDAKPRRQMCLLANLNSFVFDFCARQKIGGVTLNFFIVEQLPALPPEDYDKPCPWDRKVTLESWISERVLKLTCTAEDMLPLAKACKFSGGSFHNNYKGRLNKWDEQERAELMAELDAAYFLLYGVERESVDYILGTFNGIHEQRSLFATHVTIAEHILEKCTQILAAI